MERQLLYPITQHGFQTTDAGGAHRHLLHAPTAILCEREHTSRVCTDIEGSVSQSVSQSNLAALVPVEQASTESKNWTKSTSSIQNSPSSFRDHLQAFFKLSVHTLDSSLNLPVHSPCAQQPSEMQVARGWDSAAACYPVPWILQLHQLVAFYLLHFGDGISMTQMQPLNRVCV